MAWGMLLKTPYVNHPSKLPKQMPPPLYPCPLCCSKLMLNPKWVGAKMGPRLLASLMVNLKNNLSIRSWWTPLTDLGTHLFGLDLAPCRSPLGTAPKT